MCVPPSVVVQSFCMYFPDCCCCGVQRPTVIQIFAQYMGSISTVSTVKWLWFLINIGALAGVLIHLARVFKAGADAKGGEVAQLYGVYQLYFEMLPCGNKMQDHFVVVFVSTGI